MFYWSAFAIHSYGEKTCTLKIIQAKHAKNKRTETIPLHPELVQKLVAKKSEFPTLPVFDVPKRMTLFKKDLEVADIP